MKDFADILITYMDKTGANQSKIQKKTGVSLSTINDIILKKKSPTQRTIQRLCEGLNISMAEFEDKPSMFETVKSNMKSSLFADKQAEIDYFNKLTPEQQKAMVDKYDKLSTEKLVEKVKSLPAEHRKALELIIDSIVSK